ncbi:hypothetical protein F66182_3539 [Fusarium sp. NRRL 66182]|nr:hypothetical protein F66182_3539 [Fusarium sp. NRRL 66182]
MPNPSRHRLLWEDSGLELKPFWGYEPSLEAIKVICRRTLKLGTSDYCAVSFLTAGAFNRIYLVQLNHEKKMIMIVSLPVDPRYKTAGEVATLSWLKLHSNIPVPEVIAFDDSDNNEIGFEWILMELMQGTSAYHRWRALSMDSKKDLVEHMAHHHAHMLNTSVFRTVGTLETTPTQPMPGRLVSRMFFWGPHFDYDIPRGPFRSSYDWLESFISIILQDQATQVTEAEDEEDREDAEYNPRVAQKLSHLLPKIFPSLQNPPERTVLWHDDLSLQNIMVDEKGTMTAIIDWECVSAMPLWVATQMPKFLRGATREREPQRDEYGDETPEDVAARQEDGMDNEGKNELYWIHLLEYEQTQLREVYSEHMSRLCPRWDEIVADGVLKVDFLGAVVRCADGYNLKRIEAWADAIDRGEFPGLAETLRPRNA